MPIAAMTNPQSPIPNPGSGAKRRYFGTDGIRGRVGEGPISADFVLRLGNAYGHALRASARARRSEEHTSELQSLMRISYAVFCLKKKNNTYEKQPIQSDRHH